MKLEYDTYEDYVNDMALELSDDTTLVNEDGKTIYHYAVVMIANKGRNSSPKRVFAMEKADAMKLCNDKRTSWVSSMAIWADLHAFVDGRQDDQLSLKGVLKDNGSMDEVIEELGLRKIVKEEWKELFEPLGIKVK